MPKPIDDFDSQVNADNYVYDLLGRVVEDKAKNLVQTYNKESKILTQTIGSKVITYKYDFQSKRVSKTVVNGALTTTEFYVRDPQGNVLAIYSDTLQNGKKFTLSELHIYGSSRLGSSKPHVVLWNNGLTPTLSNTYNIILGQKYYELSNHIGNVHVTITDRKLLQGNGQNAYFIADVQSVTDYYPFGKTIPERTWSITKTRYDFNGKETDQESGYQDYGFRDYDVEICRFLQVDPLHGKYPELSTYQFASNTPIMGVDLDGKEIDVCTYSKGDKTVHIVTATVVFYTNVKANAQYGNSTKELTNLLNLTKEQFTSTYSGAFTNPQGKSEYVHYVLNPVFIGYQENFDPKSKPGLYVNLSVGSSVNIDFTEDGDIIEERGDPNGRTNELGNVKHNWSTVNFVVDQRRSDNDVMRTILHELGHMFGLPHPWTDGLEKKPSKASDNSFYAKDSKINAKDCTPGSYCGVPDLGKIGNIGGPEVRELLLNSGGNPTKKTRDRESWSSTSGIKLSQDQKQLVNENLILR